MKSLQEYIELYRGVARRLNLQGDSIEMLSQLLGNATYISEVEHVSYTQEASLERASQLNSKIQHCMNEMYSVFRGSCPRVLIHFISLSYLDYKLFDEIATFNNFSLYYLGYHDPNTYVSGESPILTYSPVSIPPNQEMTIIALISPKKLLANWTINLYNQYYVDFLESNLSSDIQVKVDGELYKTTRIFSDHIKDGSIFDLTLPDFGLRLYAPDVFRKETQTIEDLSEIPTGTKISLEAFRYSELSSYNNSELKQIKIRGTKLKPFEISMWGSHGSELSDGLIFIKEVSRDSLGTIHYKANRDKYVGSILRSNSDIGYLLEEMYPEKIYKSGTSFKFETSSIIPKETTTFGFIPEDFVSSSGENNRELTSPSKTENDPNLLTTKLTSTNSSVYPLTVYSSYSNPVKVYFNNNPEVSYLYESSSFKSLFSGSKLSLTSSGLFKNGAPFGGIVQIPISGSGTLRVFHKSSFDLATSSVYNIIPSSSIILRDDESLITEEIQTCFTKSFNGASEIINSLGDKYFIDVIYRYIDKSTNETTEKLFYRKSENIILDSNFIITNDVREVIIILKTKEEDGNEKELDRETIPVVYSETSKSSSSLGLSLSVDNDEIFLESDTDGNIITPLPINIQADVFSGGKHITSGIQYSIAEKTLGISCEISKDGLITISSVDGFISEYSILVKASYSGVIVTSLIKVKTILSEDAFKSRSIVISDDSTGLTKLKSFESTLRGELSEIRYDNRSQKTELYLWLSGTPSIDIYMIEWIKDEEVDSNVSQNYPNLTVYYIPNSISSVLTKQEIDNYINSRKSYFVTQNVSVAKGTKIKALVTLGIELFKNTSIDVDVKDILSKYANSFHVDLEGKRNEIISSIGKISNVKSLNSLDISYKTELGEEISLDSYELIDLDYSYFEIDYKINSHITG